MEKTFTVVIMPKQEIVSSDLIKVNGNDMYETFEQAVDAWHTVIDNLTHPLHLPDVGTTPKPLSWENEEWLIQVWICNLPDPLQQLQPEQNPMGNFDFL